MALDDHVGTSDLVVYPRGMLQAIRLSQRMTTTVRVLAFLYVDVCACDTTCVVLMRCCHKTRANVKDYPNILVSSVLV